MLSQVGNAFAGESENLHYSHPVRATSVCQFIPASTIENSGIAASSLEICTQTLMQGSEFRKVFHYHNISIFQAFAFHFPDLEIILKNASPPATPLYISYCTILI